MLKTEAGKDQPGKIPNTYNGRKTTKKKPRAQPGHKGSDLSKADVEQKILCLLLCLTMLVAELDVNESIKPELVRASQAGFPLELAEQATISGSELVELLDIFIESESPDKLRNVCSFSQTIIL